MKLDNGELTWVKLDNWRLDSTYIGVVNVECQFCYMWYDGHGGNEWVEGESHKYSFVYKESDLMEDLIRYNHPIMSEGRTINVLNYQKIFI